MTTTRQSFLHLSFARNLRHWEVNLSREFPCPSNHKIAPVPYFISMDNPWLLNFIKSKNFARRCRLFSFHLINEFKFLSLYLRTSCIIIILLLNTSVYKAVIIAINNIHVRIGFFYSPTEKRNSLYPRRWIHRHTRSPRQAYRMSICIIVKHRRDYLKFTARNSIQIRILSIVMLSCISIILVGTREGRKIKQQGTFCGRRRACRVSSLSLTFATQAEY